MKDNKYLIYNGIVISFYYLTSIASTLFLNIYSFIISIFFIVNYKNFFFDKKIKYILYFIVCYLTLNSILSSHQYESFLRSLSIIKNLFFVMGLLFFFRKIKFNQLLNIFSIISIFFLLLLEIDLIKQHITGVNFLGFVSPDRAQLRFGGLFRDEFIIGSFITLHIFLSFFFFLKNKYYIKYFFFLCLSLFAVVVSGEKKATIIFVVFNIIFILFYFKNNKKFYLGIFFIFVFLFLLIKFNSKVSERFIHGGGNIIKELCFKTNTKNDSSFKNFFYTPHIMHIKSAILIWRENIFFGSGLKTFRYDCHNNKDILKEYYCTTHPHNFYFEFLSELGIFGFLFISIVFFFLLKSLLKKTLTANYDSKHFVIFLSVAAYLFPFQSTGSFFTSHNLIYFSLLIAFFLYDNKNIKIK